MTSTESSDDRDPNVRMSRSIEILLEDAGLSVDQVAVYAGLSRASLYKKLAGDVGWKLTDLDKLSRYFKVSATDILSGNPFPGGRTGASR